MLYDAQDTEWFCHCSYCQHKRANTEYLSPAPQEGPSGRVHEITWEHWDDEQLFDLLGGIVQLAIVTQVVTNPNTPGIISRMMRRHG